MSEQNETFDTTIAMLDIGLGAIQVGMNLVKGKVENDTITKENLLEFLTLSSDFLIENRALLRNLVKEVDDESEEG